MHIGFIMDGNRRYANKNGLLPYAGHNAGGENLEKILELCPQYGINTVTIYALSAENLENRSSLELKGLMELLKIMAKKKKNRLIQANIKVKIVGNLDPIRKDTKEALQDLQYATSNCKGSVLQICINYGSRQEILRSVKKTIELGEELSEKNLSKNLDAPEAPNLIVRTGGRQRLSNFLLWQGAYSELYFSNKLWPEFDELELRKALEFYNIQERNFGK